MEGRISTGQSPQWAVVLMEEEEEGGGGGGGGEGGGCVRRTIMDLFLNDALTERDLLN